jgi:hypothetical protein
MNNRAKWSIFWALVAVCILMLLFVFIQPPVKMFNMGIFMAVGGIALVILGTLLIFFTVKDRTRGLLRAFLILAGASTVGITVSVVLHNAIYGLFIYFFGVDFWDRVGLPDEPVFFILGLVVCPLAFIVGTVGSIVVAIRQRRVSETGTPG